ncbi:methyltransferase family protein [Enterobacter sp. BIGb0383]|uniref:class I SAM-dependent methyltransferase n=1 Tax=unclassified Enterobacter TaxID=2608935 RepID=UPI000F4703F4|nr:MULTISPECIES: methyltransferase domain-containing protein [unclassified Enterobacter]ROP60011.1 methyltransferase family protein [Enterobacter sp. BIGb0383]ROS08521.1 methyltransferase family protein [Enterobacter sp. BIGb0359]
MTMDYYRQHADAFFSGTVDVDMASLYRPFIAALPAQGRVLDAGCGSGRDSRAFAGLGYAVDAFDASPEMVAMAREHSGLAVRQMRFDEVEAVSRYDGIWCCASLLHVSSAELPDAMQRLARALKPGGIWYVSFKYGEGERAKEGRRFTDLNETGLAALVQPLEGIAIRKIWTTADKRPERTETWLNALLVHA